MGSSACIKYFQVIWTPTILDKTEKIIVALCRFYVVSELVQVNNVLNVPAGTALFFREQNSSLMQTLQIHRGFVHI